MRIDRSGKKRGQAKLSVEDQQQIVVRFQKSDRDVTSDDEEESILEIVERAKVKIRSSCRSGNSYPELTLATTIGKL